MQSSNNVLTRPLGSQGLQVSSLGYGCMGLSAFYSSAKQITELESISVIKRAFSLGITFFDTAEIYGPFANEILLGKAIADIPRSSLQIATKTGIDVSTFKPNGKPEYVRLACERSLKNLNTDYIDLYYIHRIDTTVPIEDTMQELKKLKEEGKIKFVGLSEASANTIRRAHKVLPITAVQIEYSLWTKDVEEEIIPTCRELGIGIVSYSPLGRGFLAGAIQANSDLAEGDWRKNGCPRFLEENIQKNLKFVEKIKEIAVKKGCSTGQVSLAWVIEQNTVPIPGTSSIKHLEENVKTLEIKFSKEEIDELNKLIPPEEVSGDRYANSSTFKDN